jgi:hypothetical protein
LIETLGHRIALSLGMFIVYVILRVMTPANWFAGRRRAMKLEQMERRLLDGNHPKYISVGNVSDRVKTIRANTC